jgi:hypothetical protein
VAVIVSRVTIRQPASLDLVKAFIETRDDHRGATARTVARAALPGSVTRVFAGGTKVPLMNLLVALPLDDLPTLPGESDYRVWFENALERVADLILRRNPPEVRPRFDPETVGDMGPRSSRSSCAT